MQHCLSFPSSQPDPPALVFGPQPTRSAMRLLQQALAESGLARLAPRIAESVGAGEMLVVAFGAAAAADLLGRPVGLSLERGRLRPLGRAQLLMTEHPELILRQADPVARGREYRRLVSDLQQAVPMPRPLAA